MAAERKKVLSVHADRVEMKQSDVFDFLSNIHFGLFALEAVTMPEVIDELGSDNAHAAAFFVLEALRDKLDDAEVKARKGDMTA